MVRRIQHLNLADLVGVDFHKTGFAPYVSSLFLSKTSRDLYSIAGDPSSMPYLFKTGHYHRNIFTIIQSDALRGRGVVLSLTECYREAEYHNTTTKAVPPPRLWRSSRTC
jgi:hypothetical protein